MTENSDGEVVRSPDRRGPALLLGIACAATWVAIVVPQTGAQRSVAVALGASFLLTLVTWFAVARWEDRGIDVGILRDLRRLFLVMTFMAAGFAALAYYFHDGVPPGFGRLTLENVIWLQAALTDWEVGKGIKQAGLTIGVGLAAFAVASFLRSDGRGFSRAVWARGFVKAIAAPVGAVLLAFGSFSIVGGAIGDDLAPPIKTQVGEQLGRATRLLQNLESGVRAVYGAALADAAADVPEDEADSAPGEPEHPAPDCAGSGSCTLDELARYAVEQEALNGTSPNTSDEVGEVSSAVTVGPVRPLRPARPNAYARYTIADIGKTEQLFCAGGRCDRPKPLAEPAPHSEAKPTFKELMRLIVDVGLDGVEQIPVENSPNKPVADYSKEVLKSVTQKPIKDAGGIL